MYLKYSIYLLIDDHLYEHLYEHIFTDTRGGDSRRARVALKGDK